MCAQVSNQENRVLTFSALFASLFAVGGLVLGLIVGSLVMVFDGIYSSVSLLLTLLSLAVSKYIQKPSNKAFPFGKAVLEPIVIIIKALVILLVVSLSLYSAIMAMFNGGRAVDADVAMLFGAMCVVGCAYAWWYIVTSSKRLSSGLIEAEAMQWQMDTLLSVAITIGFAIAWVMTLTPLANYAVYADPVMMCIMSVYFIKVPFVMLKDALREILMMPPSDDILHQVGDSIDRVGKLGNQRLRLSGLTKVGRELRVNVDINPQNSATINIDDIEKTKKSIVKQLSTLPFELQLNLNIAR